MLNSHGCRACCKIFDNREWPKHILTNHCRFYRNLLCNVCKVEGFTPNSTDGVTCEVCGKKRGAGKFNKDARYDQCRKNSKLICHDCIDRRRCQDHEFLHIKPHFLTETPKLDNHHGS